MGLSALCCASRMGNAHFMPPRVAGGTCAVASVTGAACFASSRAMLLHLAAHATVGGYKQRVYSLINKNTPIIAECQNVANFALL